MPTFGTGRVQTTIKIDFDNKSQIGKFPSPKAVSEDEVEHNIEVTADILGRIENIDRSTDQLTKAPPSRRVSISTKTGEKLDDPSSILKKSKTGRP